MENLKENENAVFEMPVVQVDQIPVELKKDKLGNIDQVNHTAEQSIANLFPKAQPQSVQDDQGTISLPAVDDNADDQISTQTIPKKIKVTDKFLSFDKDLIEKAWVTKAKSIVERTKKDPNKKSVELNKIKKDYKQAKFNKLPDSIS
jgi:hypothetical protein